MNVIIKIMIITILALLYLMVGILFDATIIYLLFKDAYGPIVWLFWPITIIVIPMMFLMAGVVAIGEHMVSWIQDKIFK